MGMWKDWIIPYDQKGVPSYPSSAVRPKSVEDGYEGGRVQGRPRLGCMDGVKVALGNRGMTVEAARQCEKDRKEWRALVHM